MNLYFKRYYTRESSKSLYYPYSYEHIRRWSALWWFNSYKDIK